MKRVLRGLTVLMVVIQMVLVAVVPQTSVAAFGSYKVVGYLSNWSLANIPTAITSIEYSKLSHLIVSYVNVTNSTNATLYSGYGISTFDAWLLQAEPLAHAAGAKILVSIQGTPGDGMVDIVDNAGLRAQLVTNLTNLCTTDNLDGVDVDWEDVSAYGARTDLLIADLYASLDPLGKTVTVTGGWAAGGVGINISVAASSNVSLINVMTYDMTYPPATASPPEHAGYTDSTDALAMWAAAGFDKTKLIMGIPAYGEDSDGTAVLYREIVDALAPSATTNQMTVASVSTPRGIISITGGVLWWNGIYLAQQKVDWLKLNGYGGAFMWDAGYDKQAVSTSLLTTIYYQFYPPGAPAPTLSSLAITPAPTSTVTVGSTRQFTAIGTYSDNSTSDITASVTWASSNTGFATIPAGGLATGVLPGDTIISASLTGISSNNVTLTVSAAVVPPATSGTLPDSTPTIDTFLVYHNLLQSNDYLLLIYANIPYATTPNATASDAFYWRLFDDNNTAEYGWNTTYSYHDKGYGYAVTALYFDNTTAPTWGEECYVRLVGNGSVFTTPPTYTYQVLAADYTAETVKLDVQLEMKQAVLAIATDLFSRWELTTAQSLIAESEVDTFLSLAGQTYFRGAIYGLQGLCPQLFPYAIANVDITDRTWTLTYSNSLANQWAGTWVAGVQQAGKELFEVDYDLTSVFLVIILAAAILVANVMLAGDTWAGMIDVSIVLIASARLGLYGMGFLGLLAALGVVYVALKIWGLGR